MLVLALDTTTRIGSVALARDGRVIEEWASDPLQQPAERLPLDLVALVGRHSVELKDIDVFAVAIGPGSFTGLRIGIATMQGLAFAHQKPLIGVSGFDALAHVATTDGASAVATWVDAWRGEIYAAFYQRGRETLPPTVDTPRAALAAIEPFIEGADATVLVGDGAAVYRETIDEVLGSRGRVATPPTPLLAGAIALLATRSAEDGNRPLPHAIRPLYVRRPDAELARSQARGLMTGSVPKP